MKRNLFNLSRKQWSDILDKMEDVAVTAMWSGVFFTLLAYALMKAWVL